MIHLRAGQRSGTGGKTGSQFTGSVFNFLTMPATDGVTINTVSFNPGARTYWHSHTSGQILQVIAGQGLIQSDGEPAHYLRTGDTIWIPAGERHWHGATPDSFMTHTAISLGPTSWSDEVTDEHYSNSPPETDQQ